VGLRLQANLGSFYYIDSLPLAPQQNNHLLMLANGWIKLLQVIDIYIIFLNKLNTGNDEVCAISCAFQVSRGRARTKVTNGFLSASAQFFQTYIKKLNL
jgi:hypothetical protein